MLPSIDMVECSGEVGRESTRNPAAMVFSKVGVTGAVIAGGGEGERGGGESGGRLLLLLRKVSWEEKSNGEVRSHAPYPTAPSPTSYLLLLLLQWL
eukprot:scaffold2572_cov200-Ochromonas_danica.AAC.2